MDRHRLRGRAVPSNIFPSTLFCLILNDFLTVAFPASPRRLGSLGPLVQLGIRQSRPLEKHQSKGHFTHSWCGFSYSTGKAACAKYECLSVAFPGETSFCCEKTWVFMWCCSLTAKQSLRGSVLQPGCAAEHPGAQTLSCLPATSGLALAPWGDCPCQRSKHGPLSGGRT